VVFAGTLSSAAKVEPQDRESERMQRFHGVVNDLVVHRPAKQRVWMANQSGVRGIPIADIQQSFESACRAVEIE
jgi:hypothetical protein